VHTVLRGYRWVNTHFNLNVADQGLSCSGFHQQSQTDDFLRCFAVSLRVLTIMRSNDTVTQTHVNRYFVFSVLFANLHNVEAVRGPPLLPNPTRPVINSPLVKCEWVFGALLYSLLRICWRPCANKSILKYVGLFVISGSSNITSNNINMPTVWQVAHYNVNIRISNWQRYNIIK